MTAQHKPAEHGRGEVLPTDYIVARLSAMWTLLNDLGDKFGACDTIDQAIAALTQPKGIDWQPSVDTVNKVIRALTRLGHSTPESPEVVAIQIDQWLMTLCGELDRFMDSLPRQPGGTSGVDDGTRYELQSDGQLRVSLPRQSEAEPVGWVLTDNYRCVIDFTNRRPVANGWRDDPRKIVQPVYTTPPAQVDTTAGDGMGSTFMGLKVVIDEKMAPGVVMFRDADGKAAGFILAATAQDGEKT